MYLNLYYNILIWKQVRLTMKRLGGMSFSDVSMCRLGSDLWLLFSILNLDALLYVLL